MRLLPHFLFALLTSAATSAQTPPEILTTQPVTPAFIRAPFNPVVGFSIQTAESTTLESLSLSLEGTTRLSDVARIHLHPGKADPSQAPAPAIASSSAGRTTLTLRPSHPLNPGTHHFWISFELSPKASLDHFVDAAVTHLTFKGQAPVQAPPPKPDTAQRIGYAVRLPGDDQSKSYRIPGLVRSRKGTLIAAYDIRYRHSGDLPADIDIGISRSTDQGQSWEKMRVAMDMGNDPSKHYDGIGDPAILSDPTTGRLWIAALWSHGNHGWNSSGPGMTPEETGQLMLSHSDDDGKTWSRPRNLTPTLKDPSWRLFLAGPGAGITLRDGTLVFAAQYRAGNEAPHHGKPYATLIASRDKGKTWHVGSGVKIDTTEAQVVELQDGSLMINARDNRGGSRTIATTRDLGQTWNPHPTDRKALREPVCMASLLAYPMHSSGPLLVFSNPDSNRHRHHMSLKISADDGLTWPDSSTLLYDERSGYGYSCLAPLTDDRVGVLYEGRDSLLFLRLPVKP